VPERVVELLRVGSHELELERWQCAWCPMRLADRAAVTRHEKGCGQRDPTG